MGIPAQLVFLAALATPAPQDSTAERAQEPTADSQEQEPNPWQAGVSDVPS